MAVNVKGVAFLFKNAANQEENGGRIINIGSVIHRGGVGMNIYPATKAASGSLSSSLALELGPKNITVNTIHAGATLTDILEGFPQEAINGIIAQTAMKVTFSFDILSFGRGVAALAAATTHHHHHHHHHHNHHQLLHHFDPPDPIRSDLI
jgi:NAD(P)-dependent dehydrogenase (short-subunit alcohol dehydrogenase family)